MLRVGVLVSGGGTNLQAIIDGIKNKVITNTEIEVVISNKKDAYALVRAKENGINAECISPKDFAERKDFNQALIDTLDKSTSSSAVNSLFNTMINSVQYPNLISASA